MYDVCMYFSLIFRVQQPTSEADYNGVGLSSALFMCALVSFPGSLVAFYSAYLVPSCDHIGISA